MFNTRYIMSKGLSIAEYEEMQMLSECASKGWILDKFVFMAYKFKKAEPEKLQYSLDYRSNPDEEYFSYFNEAGWTKVCSVGNTIHIFSAPEGTERIYTDKDTEIEKHITQFESLKKISMLSSFCSILLILLMMISKNGYLPNVYGKVFFVIFIPIVAVSIFTTIPCLNHYSTINELQEMSDLDKKHKVSRFLIINAIIFIFLLVLMVSRVMSISSGIYLIIFDIILLVSTSKRRLTK